MYGRAAAAGEPKAQFRNPFNFWSVLGMAATMGVLILAGRLINTRYGAAGAVAGAAGMGFFDVDAMTVSMARLMPEGLSPREGAYALLAGVATNVLTKVAISAMFGRRRLAVRLSVLTAACLLAGWLTLMVTLMHMEP